MPRDLDVWLESVSGHSLPSGCYATIRPDDSKVSSSPVPCSQDEPSRIGQVKTGYGPVIVDVFQKVASLTLDSLEPGVLKEAYLDFASFGFGEVLQVLLRAVPAESFISSKEGFPSPKPSKSPVQKPMPPSDAFELEEDVSVVERLFPRLGLEALQAEAPEVDDIVGVVDLSGDKVWRNQTLLSDESTPNNFGGMPTLAASARAQQMARQVSSPISINNCDCIIPNLYLGGIISVADTNVLVNQGFRAVCCCTRELEYPTSNFCKDLEYFRVDVEDISREPIELYFPEATEFIHQWVSREQPVLVHCRAGVSRSASTVIAYLMDYHGYSLHDAFFLVRSHRSVITPNVGFMEKLGEYEAEKTGGEPTIEINKYISWYDAVDRDSVPDLRPEWS
eukprot:TRINITY_DN50513_c0_g1_i1.p1 TRINITY_DN50513_c0_g1~~TRINITY_DN50513_c0_g1_i1.p1  ORF type:complete len:393 (-),score=62.27 TRINITY_DN50513_c0_g1_i1:65-1243(-)